MADQNPLTSAAPSLDARLQKVSLPAAADLLTEFWSQQVVGEANGTLLKVAKGIGETRWHLHDDQDETFLVLSGRLTFSSETETSTSIQAISSWSRWEWSTAPSPRRKHVS